MKVLLTGHGGFVGGHFSKLFPSVPLVDESGGWVDILDRRALSDAMASIQPDAVVHLAGQAFVPESFRDPNRTYEINFTGTLNLLTALRETEFQGRVVFAGSSDVYGLVAPEDLPLREERPLKPLSPYAGSKAAAELLASQWNEMCDFDIVITRPFNHAGPGQDEAFVISNFAKQIAGIMLGKQQPVIHVGDIDVTRDYTDVRDVVRAYELLLRSGGGGEVYNISSGKEVVIREVLEMLIEAGNIKLEIVQDPERMRPSQQRRVAGSFEKLHRDTGWEPEIPLKQTLSDTLAYWLENLKQE